MNAAGPIVLANRAGESETRRAVRGHKRRGTAMRFAYALDVVLLGRRFLSPLRCTTPAARRDARRAEASARAVSGGFAKPDGARTPCIAGDQSGTPPSCASGTTTPDDASAPIRVVPMWWPPCGQSASRDACPRSGSNRTSPALFRDCGGKHAKSAADRVHFGLVIPPLDDKPRHAQRIRPLAEPDARIGIGQLLCVELERISAVPPIEKDRRQLPGRQNAPDEEISAEARQSGDIGDDIAAALAPCRRVGEASELCC